MNLDFTKSILGTDRQALLQKIGTPLKPFDKTKISLILTGLGFSLLRTSIHDLRFSTSVGQNDFELVNGDQLKDDMEHGTLANQYIQQCIEYAFERDADEAFTPHGLKYAQDEQYLMVFCEEAMFFLCDGEWCCAPYVTIWDVKESASGLELSFSSPYIICENSLKHSNHCAYTLERDEKTSYGMRQLRKAIESMIEVCAQHTHAPEYDIPQIIKEALPEISKSSPTYIVDEIQPDEKPYQKLKNALAKYALSVREQDAIAFIDTTLWENGKNGLLFAKDGIAFVYPFKRVFLKYDEILAMTYNKKKTALIFHGDFEACHRLSIPAEISDIFYNLPQLKECITKILYII